MIGVLIFTLLAFVFAIIITTVASKTHGTDEIEALLPGYNCGACGYKGCAHLASEIAKDPMLYKKCRTLRGEALAKMEAYIEKTYGIKY